MPAPPQLLLLLLGALLRARGKRLPRRSLPRAAWGAQPPSRGSAAGSLSRADSPAAPCRLPARARRAGSSALLCPAAALCPCPIPRPDAAFSSSPCLGGPEPPESPGRSGRGSPGGAALAGGSRGSPPPTRPFPPRKFGGGGRGLCSRGARAGAGAQVASEAAVPGVSGQPPLRSRNAAAHPPPRAP